MGKTLGINHDKWHGIFAIIAVAIVFSLLWIFVIPLTSTTLSDQGDYGGIVFVICMLISIAVAHHIQCWYETWQMRDPLCEDIYGAYRYFVINSKKDFRYFWTGIVFSWIIPALVVLIHYSLTN